MPRRSALQGVLHVPRGGLLQAELRQRVCLQYGDHDGGRLAFDEDGGGCSKGHRPDGAHLKRSRLQLVQSRHLIDCVWDEPFGFDYPLFADELVRRGAFEGLQSSPEVVGADEVGEVISQLVVVVVKEAFHSRVFYRAVHSFNLTIGPGVFDLGKPVFDLVLAADTVKDVLDGLPLSSWRCREEPAP